VQPLLSLLLLVSYFMPCCCYWRWAVSCSHCVDMVSGQSSSLLLLLLVRALLRVLLLLVRALLQLHLDVHLVGRLLWLCPLVSSTAPWKSSASNRFTSTQGSTMLHVQRTCLTWHFRITIGIWQTCRAGTHF